MDPSSDEWEIATAARSSECSAIAKVFWRGGWVTVVLGVIGFVGAAWIVGRLDEDSEVPPVFIWVWPFVLLVAGAAMIVLHRYLQYRFERYGCGVVKHTDLDSRSEEWEIAMEARVDEATELSTAFARWGWSIATLGVISSVGATLILGQWGLNEASDAPPMLIFALASVPIFAGTTMVVLHNYPHFRAERHSRRMDTEFRHRLREF